MVWGRGAAPAAAAERVAAWAVVVEAVAIGDQVAAEALVVPVDPLEAPGSEVPDR